MAKPNKLIKHIKMYTIYIFVHVYVIPIHPSTSFILRISNCNWISADVTLTCCLLTVSLTSKKRIRKKEVKRESTMKKIKKERRKDYRTRLKVAITTTTPVKKNVCNGPRVLPQESTFLFWQVDLRLQATANLSDSGLC